jgi:hypothetical protein
MPLREAQPGECERFRCQRAQQWVIEAAGRDSAEREVSAVSLSSSAGIFGMRRSREANAISQSAAQVFHTNPPQIISETRPFFA